MALGTAPHHPGMPGIDPALLQHIGMPPAGAAPAAPAAPAAGGKQDAEPVSIHKAYEEACATVAAAREMLEDLASSSEMAADMDPAAEKAITKAAELIAQVDDNLAAAAEALGSARADHEGMVGGNEGPAPAY